MFHDKIPARRFSAWLFAAVTPPLIQLACGTSWVWLLAVGGLCLFLNWARSRFDGTAMPKWLCLPGFLLTAVVLGELAGYAADSWPVGDSYPAVPLVLLALAAWSAGKGPQAAARAGAVLFWFVMIMYLLVFAAGFGQIRWEWLRPIDNRISPMSVILLLVPSAAMILPVQRKGTIPRQILALITVAAAVLLTQGILSPEIAGEAEYPFHEMGRSLELLGIAQRFEALICASATVGWFGIFTVLLSVGGSLMQGMKPGWGSGAVWTAAVAAAVWLLCGLHISGWLLVSACAVFWVGLPMLAQGIGKIKKS